MAVGRPWGSCPKNSGRATSHGTAKRCVSQCKRTPASAHCSTTTKHVIFCCPVEGRAESARYELAASCSPPASTALVNGASHRRLRRPCQLICTRTRETTSISTRCVASASRSSVPGRRLSTTHPPRWNGEQARYTYFSDGRG